MSKLTKALTAAAGNASKSLYVEDVFSTDLYEGTDAAGTVVTNGVDLGGEGGLVWLKSRNSTYPHGLFDTERGGGKLLQSNATAAELSYADISSFNSDGFTAGFYSGWFNTANYDQCSWSFRKAEKFFDVVTYTGNGTAGRTVSHDLGSVPAVMLVKSTDVAGNWVVYHKDIGTTKYLYLNTTAAEGSFDFWNATAPTDTEFTLGGFGSNNASGGTFVAYLFASDAGGFGDDGSENIIKCGSVTTDGSGNASVDVGFEPQWCLWKCIDAAGGNEHGNWRVNDVMRGWPVPDASNAFGYPSSLYANIAGGETISGVDGFIKSATGFGFGQVQANKTYIYIAIRRPMKTPESGTEVFNSLAYTGNGASTRDFDLGMTVDSYFQACRSSSSYDFKNFTPRLTGKGLYTAGASGEFTTNTSLDVQEGLRAIGFENTLNQSGQTYIINAFKRATGFMDVVAYSGTGSAHTEAHNLGVVPELIILKGRSGPIAFNWAVYSKSILNTESLFLNYPDGKANINNTYWNSTTPTNTNFSLGSGSGVNASGGEFIAYLFATLAGVSKVGSYTGTGGYQTIDCGFSNGARFILIKRTNSSGNWMLFDSVRGIVPASDPYLELNTADAEVTFGDYLGPDSSGFQVRDFTNPASNNVNANGDSYIFLAIA